MQTFLIDGFNLIHKMGRMADSSTPHQELIQTIVGKRLAGSSNNRVIIVFDGFEPPYSVSGGGFTIRFSNEKMADEIIKTIIDKEMNKKSLVVVSDDREIRSYAGISGAKIRRTQDFLRGGRASSDKKSGLPFSAADKDLTCSEMIEITEEMEKTWVKNK